jgi:hypothetical protein
MIFGVVPQELAPELFDQLTTYYADDPNVEVIVDRRKAERRDSQADNGAHRRELRDRRRPRVPGEFPQLDPE